MSNPPAVVVHEFREDNGQLNQVVIGVGVFAAVIFPHPIKTGMFDITLLRRGRQYNTFNMENRDLRDVVREYTDILKATWEYAEKQRLAFNRLPTAAQ